MVAGLLADRRLRVERRTSVCWWLLWCFGTVHAVASGVGKKADLLNLMVYALLEQGVEPGTFRFDLGEVGRVRCGC